MSGSGPQSSPLDAIEKSVGIDATDAFKSLGNEIRLAILLTLWETYEPGTGPGTLSFTELRNRVGIDDPGQFSYHLELLVGQFVTATEDGYALSRPGYTIVQTILAQSEGDSPSIEPTEVAVDCPYCGGTTAIGYLDENLFHICTECVGAFDATWSERLADEDTDDFGGFLALLQFDPAGVRDRTPLEMYTSAVLKNATTIRQAIGGLCHVCSGPVDSWLDVCEDHEASKTAMCDVCERRYPVRVESVCTVCKEFVGFPVQYLLQQHPRVVEFYTDHGVDFGVVSDPASVRETYSLLQRATVAVESHDPVRVRITFRYEDQTLDVVLDDALQVVEDTQ